MLENVLECHLAIGSSERRVVELLALASLREAVGVGWLQQPGHARWHTHTTQIFQRTQLARNLGPRCALQASNKRMGCLSGQCSCKTLVQCREMAASSASFTHALFQRKMCTLGDKLTSRRISPTTLAHSTCSLTIM